MEKAVKEESFKLFPSYVDAVMNTNYTQHIVELENITPPETIEKNSTIYRLKSFQRGLSGATFLEKVYIKSYEIVPSQLSDSENMKQGESHE